MQEGESWSGLCKRIRKRVVIELRGGLQDKGISFQDGCKRVSGGGGGGGGD
jgi:hypothetical protein